MGAGPGPDDRDLAVSVVPGQEAPEGGGRVMAQDGVRPAGLDSSEEAALERRIRMSDRVDTSVQRMERAPSDPDADRVTRQPATSKLGIRVSIIRTLMPRAEVAGAWVGNLSPETSYASHGRPVRPKWP